ncbi:HAMP domain-containing sensor histidine kinase [Pseudoduganella ginsengisoli]|uniref:histidine kinase n=2 Tax=Pseudoduganella ginsengisoli TaxID=1462440 RepID=A0A6L6PYA4_9BURK|nr:sensor histidine kinase [Pseudoduganella ginsengisoli]
MSWIALVGMPLYYVVWHDWFPQPYENLWLRLAGMAVCLPGICAVRFARQRWFPAYQVAGLTYILPFFFTYMYLMNGANSVWSESLLIAVILLFHFDFALALLSYVIGTSLAYALYYVLHADGTLVQLLMQGQWPIYLFAIVAVSLAKVGRGMLEAERLAGMAAAMGTVSHELRTPLLSIDANSRGMKRLLQQAPGMQERDRVAMEKALARVEIEVRHMNNAIDLLLLSSTASQRTSRQREVLSMQTMVKSMLERYPFANPGQAELVAVTVRADFQFLGQSDLCSMVLLNLLRNALAALQRAGKGRIRIIIDGTRAQPRLLFIDTGSGIDPARQPHIFRRFYTYPQGSGSGIGLSFCQEVLDAWNVTIRCISRLQRYTIFALDFPRPVFDVTDFEPV